jgi:hypothetical protein
LGIEEIPPIHLELREVFRLFIVDMNFPSLSKVVILAFPLLCLLFAHQAFGKSTGIFKEMQTTPLNMTLTNHSTF